MEKQYLNTSLGLRIKNIHAKNCEKSAKAFGRKRETVRQIDEMLNPPPKTNYLGQ